MTTEQAPPTPSGAPVQSAKELLDPALRRLAVVVVLGMIMSILDTTIVNVALDTLARDFHAQVSEIQWVSTGYLLALAAVIPMAGWAVERFGAKSVWLVSLSLFIVGSALCGLSWSLGSLIIFRVVQGLGGGMIMPVGMTIMARQAGPQRMGRVMSVIGVPTLLGPILGPVIGGLIVSNTTWRWIFFVNIPIGLVALALAWRILPSGGRVEQASKLDILGVCLLSPALASLVYGLSQVGGIGGALKPSVVIGLLTGVVLAGAFVAHALRSANPLLDMRLFNNRSYALANTVTFIIGAVLFGVMFLLPLYYQVVRGQSPLAAGLLMAPQGIGAACVMPLAGRIADQYGSRRVVPLGMTVMTVSSVVFGFVSPTTSEVLLAFALFVRGIGLGMSMMPTMAAAYQTLDHAAIPRATTLLNIVQRVGGSLGIAVLAVVLQVQIRSHTGSSGGVLSGPPGSVHAAVADHLATAFAHTFWWSVVLSGLGIIPALFLPRRRAVEPGPTAAAPAAVLEG
ncbi:MAG TPA: MDR family MFS transporter [Acidimicrobiales bacterium]|nr:MDR family MFS transporter [Acidimicrobiales bacterium]